MAQPLTRGSARLGRLLAGARPALRGRPHAPLHCALSPLAAPPQRRSAATRAHAASQQQPAPRTSPLAEPFLLTLERAVGDRAGADATLAASGLFGAEVFPDLPLATSWEGLYKAMLKHVRQVSRHTEAHDAHAAAAAGSGGAASDLWRVETIGAQLRDAADLQRRICAACGRAPTGAPLSSGGGGGGRRGSGGGVAAANALLFVSGSHPARSVPGVDRILPGSVSLLRTAAQLRGAGAIPAATSLWAVANPVTERDAGRTAAKIEAGAEVILTQPPLDWPAFEKWWDDVRRRELHTAAKILVGFPALSSAGNASFWLALSGGGGSAEARRVVAGFAAAEERGKGAGAEHAARYAREQLAKLHAVPGISGLHVMPLTPAARRLTLDLAAEGLLTPQRAAAQQQAQQT